MNDFVQKQTIVQVNLIHFKSKQTKFLISLVIYKVKNDRPNVLNDRTKIILQLLIDEKYF